ncbi:unnamed protein product [Polarella glacialis]|uniref:Protease Do-like PDZ domain-containing protein n=1 Tax=Polarella glacialis TaxID=89957 RepID=A0A813JND6_POLGL|nr:unnamed protein product [Polarella glacialis]
MPWQAGVVESSTGSGAVIELPGRAGSNGILTAAHVVANARFLQLQRSSDRFSSERSQARVAAICHEIDLALLVPEGEESWAEMKPLAVASADRLPQIFDRVRVCYPVGGNACSVTEGVVSRIEVQEYSHSLRPALALTVDAAINSGNSGGPLLDARTGEIVGVAFQKLVAQGVELQGHAVPAPLICQFLRQVAAAASLTLGRSSQYTLEVCCDFQTLEPLALRRSLGKKVFKQWVLVFLKQKKQCLDMFELRSGDVLLTFDGLSLDSSGFCKVLGQRLHFAAARDLRGVGEVVQLTVWRGSQEVALNVRLRPEQNLVPRPQFDCCPPFFVCGGLVFQPLSFEYLQAWEFGSEPTHLRDLFCRGRLQPDRTEAVVLTQILGDDINQGYGSGFVGAPVVVSVNGQQVVNLAHLVRLVRTLRAQAQSTDLGAPTIRFQNMKTEQNLSRIPCFQNIQHYHWCTKAQMIKQMPQLEPAELA